MSTYATYARVSTEEQSDRGTIQNQAGELDRYCQAYHITDALAYVEDGVSGTIPLEQRPAGAQLLADARASRFTILLVYRLDRLGRNTRLILNAVHELEQHGVEVRSITEQFDSGTPAGRFLLQMLAGVGELERATILERSRLGTERLAREGKWLGGIVPYGYTVDDAGFLAINEDTMPCGMSEADVIRLIYRLCADDGWSTTRIADHLNALGVPTTYQAHGHSGRGKRQQATAGIWRDGGISRLLRNATYRGEHSYGRRSVKKRELIVRAVPAIVTPEQWHQAQATLRGNMIHATRYHVREYLLRGLIVCGACGRRYCGTRGKSSASYVCGGKQAHHITERCTNRNVPADWIEGEVWQACVDFISNPGDVVRLLVAGADERAQDGERTRQEQEGIAADLSRLEGEREKVLLLFRKDFITSADVEKQLTELNAERSSLERRRMALDGTLRDQAASDAQLATIEETLATLREVITGDLDIEERRAIVRALVKEIIVLPEEEREEGTPRPPVRLRVVYTFGGGNSAHGHPCRELPRTYGVSVNMGVPKGTGAWWQVKGLPGIPQGGR
jgi:site-specific DNA recombinase